MIKKIKNLTELNRLAKRKKGLSCFIALNDGLRSSKFITYDAGKRYKTYWVFNLIDDTEQNLTVEEIFDASITNIGVALEKGALYED